MGGEPGMQGIGERRMFRATAAKLGRLMKRGADSAMAHKAA